MLSDPRLALTAGENGRIADDLADRGYEIITAQDGVEALERIGEARPDVIVLDLMLPGSDGWELTREYQTVTGGEVIPIVVVSAARNPDLPTRAAAFAAIKEQPPIQSGGLM